MTETVASGSDTALGGTPTTSIELTIGGMTCSSCAMRIEKKLNKLDGVSATVNYATEKAKVTFVASVSPADLVATVEATGYTALLPAPPVVEGDDADAAAPVVHDEAEALKQRLVICADVFKRAAEDA